MPGELDDPRTKELFMFRAHVTKITAVFLLTLALGVVSSPAPARAAGFSSERPGRWEQLVEGFFGWLLKSSGCIDPLGGALCSLGAGGGNASRGDIDPAGKAGTTPPAGTAALCLDTTACINPDGRH